MPETRELGEALLPPLSPPADIPQGIADVSLDGLTVKFRVENGQDVIQRFHINGRFYELNQLRRHLDLIWYGSAVLDVAQTSVTTRSFTQLIQGPRK